MRSIILTLILLLILLSSTASAFTLTIPKQQCFGFATYCDSFHNMRKTCLQQTGCSWIGGDPYGKCVGHHVPCVFYRSYNMCEKNYYCEWRG